jgi:hypothetical protein
MKQDAASEPAQICQNVPNSLSVTEEAQIGSSPGEEA